MGKSGIVEIYKRNNCVLSILLKIEGIAIFLKLTTIIQLRIALIAVYFISSRYFLQQKNLGGYS